MQGQQGQSSGADGGEDAQPTGPECLSGGILGWQRVGGGAGWKHLRQQQSVTQDHVLTESNNEFHLMDKEKPIKADLQ